VSLAAAAEMEQKKAMCFSNLTKAWSKNDVVSKVVIEMVNEVVIDVVNEVVIDVVNEVVIDVVNEVVINVVNEVNGFSVQQLRSDTELRDL
ncbi:hypothetical protein Tco_1290102, partial [Tanacetum coccineum]